MLGRSVELRPGAEALLVVGDPRVPGEPFATPCDEWTETSRYERERGREEFGAERKG